jgi:hypothetical protein
VVALRAVALRVVVLRVVVLLVTAFPAVRPEQAVERLEDNNREAVE